MTKISATVCPHCGALRDKPYSRKTKCPDCGEHVYVRSGTGFIFGRVTLKLEETFISNFYLSLEQSLNLHKEHYTIVENKLKDKWKADWISPRDVVWAISNDWSLVERAAKETSYDLPTLQSQTFAIQSYIQEDRAIFVAKFHKKDPADHFKEAKKSALTEHKLANQNALYIESAHCCFACEKIDSQRITTDQALESMPLPQTICTRLLDDTEFTHCSCLYKWDWERDSPYIEVVPNGIEEFINQKPRKKRGFWSDLFS